MPTGERVSVFCSRGGCLKSSQRPKEFDKNNNDVSSIPDYLTKNRSRDAKHGTSERQKMYHKTEKNSSRKARRIFIHTWAMEQWLPLQKVVVRYWMDKRAHNASWQNCLGETFIRCNKSWENSKFETQQRRSSATTKSTSTWQGPNKNTEIFLAVKK